MGNKRTIKALEELVKTEHMAVGALDSALEEVDDNRLRKQYRKWRDAHMKQADALNDRLEELGGEPLVYEPGSKAQGRIWGKITSVRDDSSVAAMRVGAERGIKRYIDHLDEVDDAKALNIIRKNLEAKQDEIDWYDTQASKERSDKLDTRLETTQIKAEDIEAQDGKKGGGLPFPLLVALGAIGAAAFFLLRRGEESDYDDYGEDAFRYEGEDETTSTDSGSGGFSQSGSLSSSGTGNGAGSEYSSMSGSTGESATTS
jgi:bacterioferritin (cytochrome b1)